LQIQQNPDGATRITLNGANDVKAFFVVLMGAMAEVEAKNVSTRFKQSLNGLTVDARRAQCGDDLGISVTVHLNSYWGWVIGIAHRQAQIY
jgi:hypothetical protein